MDEKGRYWLTRMKNAGKALERNRMHVILINEELGF